MFLRASIICALIMAMSFGCRSQTASQNIGRETSRLRLLVNLYQTAARGAGRMPKNEQELKQLIHAMRPELLDRILTAGDVKSVDELFVSERDSQPYVIFYGGQPKGVANDLIAYERTGASGKRYVGYGLGIVSEEDEEHFTQLVPASSRPN
jgi:hypothetical protein